MGKTSSKKRKPGLARTKPGEVRLLCHCCGTLKSDQSILTLIDDLLRSHAELCTTLRTAGRQMLRLEVSSDVPLEKVREVLKRGDHIRRALARSDRLKEGRESTGLSKLVEETPESASDNNSVREITGSPKRNRTVKSSRVKRRRSPRVLKFPSGSAGAS